MRIGIDACSLLSQPTGVGRVLKNLFRALSQIDRENEYILFLNGESSNDPTLSHNFKRCKITLPIVEKNFTWLHLRLPLALFKDRVDLFHYTFYTMPFFINCHSVVSIHDLSYELHPEWFSWRSQVSFRPFSRWAALQSRKIITYAGTTKREIVKRYGVKEEKICVIYHGVDPKFQMEKESSKIETIKGAYGIQGRYILYVGNINIRRNVERLLQAFRPFSADYQLILVGKVEWPWIPLPRLIQDLNLIGRVIHLGYVEDDHLPILYNGAEVFVYPSLYEGFGLPVIEAMACGTPVITSRSSALEEIYSDTAILVNPYRIQEIEDALRTLLNDSRTRESCRERGLALVKKFSWERAAQDTLKVYHEAFEA